MLLGGGTAPGVYFRIKNNTNHVIADLYFSHGNSIKQKVGKIKQGDYKQLLILNSFIFQDEDLIIEDGTGKQFTFEKMVKKYDNVVPYHYNFYKVEDEEDSVKFVKDEEGRKKFFEHSQVQQ